MNEGGDAASYGLLAADFTPELHGFIAPVLQGRVVFDEWSDGLLKLAPVIDLNDGSVAVIIDVRQRLANDQTTRLEALEKAPGIDDISTRSQADLRVHHALGVGAGIGRLVGASSRPVDDVVVQPEFGIAFGQGHGFAEHGSAGQVFRSCGQPAQTNFGLSLYRAREERVKGAILDRLHR